MLIRVSSFYSWRDEWVGEKEGCGGVRIYVWIDCWFMYMSWWIFEEVYEF